MKKLTSILAAAVAAVSIGSAACAAPLYNYEPYSPVNVLIVEDEDSARADGLYAPADGAESGAGKLYLSADISEEAAEEEEQAKTFTAQDILKMAGISLAIGLIAALIVCLIMKSCMKTARPKNTANDYIRKNSFHITRSRDIFIYAELSKKKRVKEENKK